MVENDIERERAMFQPVDRQYLRGEKEYATDQGEYSRQQAIRERLFGGIIDFRIAQRNLSEWNWKKFLDLDRQDEMELRSGMVAAMALFYEIHHAKGWDFSTTLRDAVEEAYKYGTRRQMPPQVVEQAEFQVFTREPEKYREIQERIIQKLDEGHELTDHEIRVAIELGGVDLIPALKEYLDEVRKEKSREETFNRLQEKLERFGEPETNG